MKPYYADGAVTIFHGDCREVLDGGPGILGQADAVVADPPYAETSLPWDHWPSGWVEVVADNVPVSSPLWCFGSLRMFMERGDEFRVWKIAQDLVWEKHNGSGFHADRFKRVHEMAVQWYRGAWADVYKAPATTSDATKRQVRRKERPPHMGEIENTTYVSEDGGPRLARSVLYVRSTHGRAIHPTQKPEGILEPLLRYSVPPGGLVLDPFMGSGSTLHVAKAGGWRAVGIEADEQFCEKAARWLSSTLDLGGA